MYLLHGYVVFCCGNLSLINYLSLALFGTEYSNYCTIALISHASKIMLKIVNRELPDVQAGFQRGRGTRDEIASIRWIMGKARELQKNTYFCFIDYTKALTVWITTNCGKFLKIWEYQTTLPVS